jgi:hypothetical protein
MKYPANTIRRDIGLIEFPGFGQEHDTAQFEFLRQGKG